MQGYLKRNNAWNSWMFSVKVPKVKEWNFHKFSEAIGREVTGRFSQHRQACFRIASCRDRLFSACFHNPDGPSRWPCCGFGVADSMYTCLCGAVVFPHFDTSCRFSSSFVSFIGTSTYWSRRSTWNVNSLWCPANCCRSLLRLPISCLEGIRDACLEKVWCDYYWGCFFFLCHYI